MGLFSRKKKNKEDSTSSYTSQKEDLYSSYSSQSEYSINNHDEDEDDFDVGIKFKKELSNGAFIFLIIDDDSDWIGSYVIVSTNGVAKIVDNKFDKYDEFLNDTNCNRLKKTAEAFYWATK